MFKASALYIAIIVATVIAILSASLISTAYFYRWEERKIIKRSLMQYNLKSGIYVGLSPSYQMNKPGEKVYIDLYGNQSDSLCILKSMWGMYDYLSVKAINHLDTLKKALFIGIQQDDPVAIYLSDEDRPVSVSGDTRITGDALLPKSGIKQAYVEGMPYKGKKLVDGTIMDSQRTLPPLNPGRLDELKKALSEYDGYTDFYSTDIENSFHHNTLKLNIDVSSPSLEHNIKGNIILFCDTVLTIKKYAHLEDILIFARAIIIEEGFEGNCQLFAKDSIIISKNVKLNYPSALAVLADEKIAHQARLEIGENTLMEGIILTYEPKRSYMQTLISLGKYSKVIGEVYATGMIKMEKPLKVEGKVSCNTFIIQTKTSLYENYLIDVEFNRKDRSSYYLTSSLFGQSEKSSNQILKWLK